MSTDGVMWTFGDNADGQLGDGTTVNKNVPVTVTCSNMLSLTINVVNVTCLGMHNGSATAIAGGGTAPYTYLWSTGGTSSSVKDLAPGTYTCKATDASSLTTITAFTITEPNLISFITTSIDACNGNNGNITIIANGGTKPYQYSISSPTYQSSNVFTGLSAGSYNVIVRDANGCIFSNIITIANNNTPPPTANSQIFDDGTTVADLVASGTNIKWYADPVSSNVLSLSTVLQTGTYYASQTINGCESSTRLAITITIKPIQIDDKIPTNGLIAYYPFSSNANDVSGNKSNGSVTSAVLTTDRFGNSNSAYSFEGAGSYIDATIANIPQGNAARTISGWFKTNTPNPGKNGEVCVFNYGALSRLQRFGLTVYSKGYLETSTGPNAIGDDFYVNNFNYLSNDWYFFTLTYNGTKVSLYVNGVFVSEKNATLNTTNNLFRIGKRISGDTTNEYFKGKIDDIGIWNRVLTPEEISAMYTPGEQPAYTLISDANFEKKLIALGIDSGAVDGKVLTSNINTLTSLDISKSNISDLTGIQDFVLLTNLNCSQNSLTSLNVSKNTALTVLDCNNNQIASLDVSNNVALTDFVCYSNKLTSLDVKKNTALTKLDSGSNQYASLDVSNNTALTFLGCNTSQLTTLDVSKNTALNLLDCRENKITTLNVSKITILKELYCQSNQLKDLDISKNKVLEFLNCSKNQLTTLDVSVNNALVGLYSNSNQLTSLNLKNGNNDKFAYLNLTNNPNLTCIQVDDLAYANTNWTAKKDATANFSVNCSKYTLIPDVNFEKTLIAKGIDSGTPDGQVSTLAISSVTDLSLYDYPISDLTGIEGFTSLTNLYVSNSQLASINLSQNTKLKNLNVGNNKLTSLDTRSNTLLETLDCSRNNITNLNLSTNSKLAHLNVFTNQITSLDLSQNTQLLDLNISTNKISNLDISTNVLLQTLDCRLNTLTVLNISKNVNLTNLNTARNQLGSLDVSQNTQLKNLTVSSNKLTNLNIDKNTALTSLTCDNNKLTNLDVSKNTLLTSIICHYNQIDVLDVSKNITLEQLMCHGNKLAVLDVSLNPELNLLDCLDNKLTSLDISKNPKITELACQNNQLQTLNLKNGHNDILDLTFSDFTNNPNLYCIQVDDATYSDTNWKSVKNVTASYNTNCSSMFTQIPDVNFERKLIALGIDSGIADGKVLTKKIAAVTSLNISSSSISDLKGIEYFTSLTYLACDSNNLKTIDVSKNTALTDLNCGGNKLTTLDLSKNIALTNLACTSNQLKTLNISQCSELTFLKCSDNSLSSLDLSNNSKLQILDCSNNQLTNLSLDKNINLLALTTENNQLTTLDVKDNLILDLLDFSGNHIKTVDISKQKNLTQLFCGSNELKMLDVSKNNTLKILNCSNNPPLQSLNLKNGNNTNIFSQALNLSNNPALTCIEVDDVDYSNNNWADKKDTTANYNLDCPEFFTLIPDKNFEQKLIDLGIDSGTPDGKVATAYINYIITLDVADSNISDLTGLQDFASLKYFFCDRNKLTTADFSKNLMLENIGILDNAFTSIDVTKNTKLHTLELSKNHISTVDLSQNINLKRLGFENNNFKEIDLSHNTELWFISGFENQLTNLDLSKNAALTTLNVSNNQLVELNLRNGKNNNILESSLDLRNNPNLTCILVDDVAYSNRNWTSRKDATASFSLDCLPKFTLIPDVNFEQKLISLGLDSGETDGKVLTSNISDVKGLNLYYSNISDLTGIENFKALDSLNVMSNKLTRLDVSKNLTLKYLVANYNNLTEIDLSKNVALEYLIISNNSLKTIDVSKNLSLQYFTCSTNQLTDVDVSNNKLLILFNCEANQIATIDVSKNTSLTNFRCSDNPLLTNINLKNGNNGSMQLESYVINFSKNPLLKCIVVDNAIYSNEKWSGFKDATASYSTVDCSQITSIPDPAFEDKLIALKIDNDGKNGTVLNSSISSITSLNVVASNIKDLTGIKGFTSLQTLNCSANQLAALDISQNKNLTSLDCSSNKLVSLNLKNGNNKNFNNNSNFTKNLDLSCIQVDDQAYSNQNWTSFKDSTANYNVDCTIYTTLPDSNFEQKLIDLGIDKDGLNGKIATADISSITSLDLSGANITDISGIEYFTTLKYLDLSNNNLSTVDVSKNTLLIKLDLNYNQLTSLDVSANKDLFNLSFAANKISSIDLSKNTKLHSLTADYNSLSRLDLTANNEIEQLSCGTNKLTILDTSNLSNLSYLSCELNQISELNLSNNIKLDILQCYSNNLSTLDLTHNTELTRLNAASNHLTTLDLSANKKLVMVYLEFNPLTSLNVQNGNNENFVLPSQTGKKSADGIKYSSFLQLKSLSCIQVDNVAYSNEHWANIKEPSTTYSSTCKQLGLEDAALNHANIYPNPTKDILNISNVSFQKITVYDTTGKLVKTFSIHAENTDFNTIDLSGLPKGVYYLYLINQNAATAKKIVVE